MASRLVGLTRPLDPKSAPRATKIEKKTIKKGYRQKHCEFYAKKLTKKSEKGCQQGAKIIFFGGKNATRSDKFTVRFGSDFEAKFH